MNRNRLLLIGFIALALGAFVSFVVYRNLVSKAGSKAPPGEEIIVAADDLQVVSRPAATRCSYFAGMRRSINPARSPVEARLSSSSATARSARPDWSPRCALWPGGRCGGGPATKWRCSCCEARPGRPRRIDDDQALPFYESGP